MKMVKCLHCKSTDLVLYSEEVTCYESRLTKKGTVAKQRIKADCNYLVPNHIRCNTCDAKFDYITDEDKKIHLLED